MNPRLLHFAIDVHARQNARAVGIAFTLDFERRDHAVAVQISMGGRAKVAGA